MKKFKVTIQEIHSVQVEVEAKNQDEARETANQMIIDEKIHYSNLLYSHHIESFKWPVEKI